jgi:acyl carrier protein
MKQARAISSATLIDDLTTIIANVLDRDRAEIEPGASLVDQLEVDSVMRLEILVVLERTYGVKFGQEDLVRIATVNDIRDLLLEKAGEKGGS